MLKILKTGLINVLVFEQGEKIKARNVSDYVLVFEFDYESAHIIK